MCDLKNKAFELIRTARGKRYLTNCYSLDVIDHIQNLWQIDDQFIFSYEDHGVKRLVFGADKWSSIDELIKLVKSGKYYLEFMTKDSEEYIPDNSTLIARMKRLANSDCSSVFSESAVIQFKNSAEILQAKVSDIEEINSVLWSTFNTAISHLLTDQEIEQKIEQFSIHKNNDGHIDAILQAEVFPKKFYINQIVNLTNKNVIHAILLNRLEQYALAGGKYLYAWVEENNIASMKFHEKYGMQHDGMYSLIYCIER